MGKNKSAKETFSISASSSRPKPAPLQDLSYTAGINFPPCLEEEEDENQDGQRLHKGKQTQYAFPVISDKKLKKLESKEISALHAAETAKTEADHDAFNVVIRSKTSGEDTRDANVKDITIKSFSVSVQGKQLLNNTSLIISHGKRYGLVGANGTGKSTLLKLLAWSKLPVPKNTDILLVEQEVASDDKTAVEAVVSANEELVKLREEASSLQESDNGEKLAELYEKLQTLGSDAAEAQASKILAGLGFTKEMQVRSTKSFSGGWRMRISLAGALFVRPTLLLLDEPTNHLDLRAVLWLEEYLCRWKNTLVVVSHGLDFLNTVCTDIIHLEDQKLNFYGGNYDAFEKQYGKLRKVAIKKCLIHEKQLIKAANNQEKAKAEEASKRKGKGKGKKKEEEGTASQGPPKRWRDYTVKLTFPEPTELAPPLLQLLEVSFSYPERADFKLSDVDLGIDMGTRVVIVGPNGAGKSTLLKLVAGDLVPTEGEVRRSQNLRVGRYCQHFVDQLKMEETPVNYLLRLHPDLVGDQEAARATLGKFGLQGNNQITSIAMLSGGQKARVVLASISMMKPHILLLDEPTNHMDMQTIDALADALDRFKGGVVLVSHDSRLTSRVCEDEEKSEIWVVKDGTVTFFQGTFEEYKEELKREIKAEVDELST